MKIYVVTFCQDNYGSILQAYALQRKLAELGGEPYVLMKKESPQKRPLVLKILKYLKPQKNYPFLTRIRIRNQNKKFKIKKQKLNEFIKHNIKISTLDTTSNFDSTNQDTLMIAGSDQVWSVIQGELSDWYSLRWTNVPKKYSYAASLGYVDFEQEKLAQYETKLADFKTISIREKQAYDRLKKSFEGKIRVDVDPTLLFDGEYWGKLVTKNTVGSKYIFLYMLRPNKELVKNVTCFARQNGLNVIYTGIMADNYSGVSTVVDAGIEDFLSYIYNAEYVVTNSFHGTVFSILFHKKFITSKIASTSSRTENLLELLELKSRMIEENATIPDSISEEINYARVDNIISCERNRSIDYLKSIVSGEYNE